MTIKDPPPSNLSTWLPISPLTWPQYHLLHMCWRGEGEGESPELRCGLGRVCPLSSPAWWDGWRNCCWEASRWDGWYMLSREWRKFTCTAGNVNSRLLLFLLDGQLVSPLCSGTGSHTLRVFHKVKQHFISGGVVCCKRVSPPESTRCWCICRSSPSRTGGTSSRSGPNL